MYQIRSLTESTKIQAVAFVVPKCMAAYLVIADVVQHVADYNWHGTNAADSQPCAVEQI